MRPFEAPANANAPAVSPLLWFQLPMASYAAAIDVAAYQMRCWATFQQAAIDMSRSVCGARAALQADTADAESSPVMACAAADVRSAGAAMLQAQMDAMEAFRRSA